MCPRVHLLITNDNTCTPFGPYVLIRERVLPNKEKKKKIKHITDQQTISDSVEISFKVNDTITPYD